MPDNNEQWPNVALEPLEPVPPVPVPDFVVPIEEEMPPQDALDHEALMRQIRARRGAEKLFEPAPHPGARKFDQGKPLPRLLHQGMSNALSAVVRVLSFGAIKYAPNGWKELADAEERYTDAMYRHLGAMHAGEELDPESGESHLAHAACNIMFLLELRNAGNQ